MTDPATIVRVAAKGDGMTADGRHIAFSAPGDVVLEGGGLERGPHHVEPPCQHFRSCGGCSLQHLDDESYAQFLLERITYAVEGQGVECGKIHAPQISSPKSRIRVRMRAAKAGKELKLGFSGAGSHRIIDLRQCEIMHPELFALIAPLREFLTGVARKKHDMNVEMSLVDQGVDLLVKNYEPEDLKQRMALADFAQEHDLARLSVDTGYGAETQWEPDPVTVTLGTVAVHLPHQSFLQPTLDGRDALVKAVNDTICNASKVADLFCGVGTFALSLNPKAKIYAAEGSRDSVTALKTAANIAGRQVFTEHRDLFRRPLSPEELDRFDAVILDPPRAGARDQVAQIALSQVPVIAYVSCNPASFARDAKRLCDAGYVLEEIWPVGQFLWSTHVELAAKFVKQN